MKPELAEKARLSDAEYEKMELELAKWWAEQPIEDDITLKTVSSFIRWAYGQGYMAAIQDNGLEHLKS